MNETTTTAVQGAISMMTLTAESADTLRVELGELRVELDAAVTAVRALRTQWAAALNPPAAKGRAKK